MTREEHIENLKAIASDMPSDKCADWIESLMAGVKALEAESESRMSYVQEAVNAIMNTCNTDSITDKAMRNAARFVQNAIDGSYPDFEELDQEPCSVTPMQKWIPISERLPEEGVSVLVYAERNAYGDNGKYRKKVIDIGWQVDGHWHIDGCNGVVGIAWMPLPEPYK